MRYCSLNKHSDWSRGFWIKNQGQIFPRHLGFFFEKVRRPLVLSHLGKKEYIWMDQIFVKNPKTSCFGSSWPNGSFLKNQTLSFVLLFDYLTPRKKKQQKNTDEPILRSCIADKQKSEWTLSNPLTSQIHSTLLLARVPINV